MAELEFCWKDCALSLPAFCTIRCAKLAVIVVGVLLTAFAPHLIASCLVPAELFCCVLVLHSRRPLRPIECPGMEIVGPVICDAGGVWVPVALGAKVLHVPGTVGVPVEYKTIGEHTCPAVALVMLTA